MQKMKNPASTSAKITEAIVMERLNRVLDPELHVGIVDLGLIYDVSAVEVEAEQGKLTRIHILMTLTTPGCPLAGMFDRMIKDALFGLEGINVDRDVTVELTFDPPWLIDMMNPETRAQLGL